MRAAAALGLLFFASFIAFAQTVAPQPSSTIQSSTEIVTVPVIVTDRAGRSVRGLMQADFRVRENGKPQRIASFEEVSADGRTVPTVKAENGIYSNRINAAENPVALGILILDFVDMRALSQYWAVRGALNFLDKWKGQGGFKQPMMLAAITPSGLQIVHEATTDPAVLEEAMALIKVRPSATGVTTITPTGANTATGAPIATVTEAQKEAAILERLQTTNRAVTQLRRDADTRTVMWALQAVANGVAGIPGRKALMWTSEVFPWQTMQSTFDSPQWADQHGTADEAPDLKHIRDATYAAFNRANVSVYPVSAPGLMADGVFDTSWSFGQLFPMNLRTATTTVMIQEPRLLADSTAGFQCHNSNDIAECLGRVINDAGHYYMLSYYPDPRPKSGGWRHISVDVAKEHVAVRARKEYLYGAAPSTGSSAKEEVAVALKSSLAYTSLPITVRFTGLRPGAGSSRLAQFVIGIDGRALTIDEQSGNRVNLLIAAQSTQAGPPFVHAIDAKLKSDAIDQVRASQLTQSAELALTPGKYDVRVVVRDNLTGRIGSVVAPIEVQ